ncbi:MAG: AMP-binding protein [Clostridia bacterium]|nr:AMP-binding protein [Clostridia bacterium]
MKKLQNIGGHPTIQSFVDAKIAAYEKQEKTFRTLFDMMFSERENIMAEITDGYRIKKVTYGEFRERIVNTAPSVKAALGELAPDSIVGLYMENSMDWLVAFWSILMSGYRPLLMNTRLGDAVLEGILRTHSVAAVISDGKRFSVPTLIAAETLTCGEAGDVNESFGSEVIFMTSGTTEHVKLCAYTGENFFYQVKCSSDIVKQCPDIAVHYDGELRQLMLLPLYHVFGFIAVYLWFGFFARTFVFLKDMNPSTILNTVRKHRVTHIFAVPLVWDTIYREAMRKIGDRGDATAKRFERALALCNRTGKLGDALAKRLLTEVRDGIFGDSICFMISGGSSIRPEVVSFFNGIGYPLVNGYGMTEVGITSVELHARKAVRNKASIGEPFGCVAYRVSENGELLISSRAMASRIIDVDGAVVTTADDWFCSHDLARCEGDRYYLEGRADDLIVGPNGENINPSLVEQHLKVDGCQELCLFKSQTGEPVLAAYAPSCRDEETYARLKAALADAVEQMKLACAVKTIVLTTSPLMEGAEFKISRRRLASRYADGTLAVVTDETVKHRGEQALSATEERVRGYIAQALKLAPDKVGKTDHFFTDLGGTSLDYFALKELIKQHDDVDIMESGATLATVEACARYLAEKKGD